MRFEMRPAKWTDEARETLAKCSEPDITTQGGLASVADLEADGQLFECEIDGEIVGNYVLRVIRRSNGTELQVVAAAGRAPGVDLSALGMAAIFEQARTIGADAVALHTRRMGLVKKLARAGFMVDGFILRRRVAPCH